ncbi:PaaI family thioesterase [Glaciimonas sp. Gout2]|uniref:PaaI family thioesterase n=1 Tax=unclassified Glaciimonas TaxID=2644401 RepID=UPI002AB3E06A|nr:MULTISPECIES: PaaI family thioesterase [unclassified Glaciimonas]MDY7547826.1 PaaI family thioesterase [Glaciimonas sp. CA11.2]MEB0010000.1 PaaI family thioesterase [Glaciimonas sp. Cout2]MEB0081885.1 PaaI family thioesterase [Glaciimonas sp. Gout2]
MFPKEVFPLDNPFLKYIGVEFVEMGEGTATLQLDLQPHHMNSGQVTHGGVTMTMLDVVMALAGRTLNPQASTAVTVEMKTSFLQPGGRIGGHLVAKGKAFHRSATMCFCEAELWNDEKLVAKSLGTFKYLKNITNDRKVLREFDGGADA